MIFLRKGKNRKKLLRLIFVTIFINFQLERRIVIIPPLPLLQKKKTLIVSYLEVVLSYAAMEELGLAKKKKKNQIAYRKNILYFYLIIKYYLLVLLKTH